MTFSTTYSSWCKDESWSMTIWILAVLDFLVFLWSIYLSFPICQSITIFRYILYSTYIYYINYIYILCILELFDVKLSYEPIGHNQLKKKGRTLHLLFCVVYFSILYFSIPPFLSKSLFETHDDYHTRVSETEPKHYPSLRPSFPEPESD